MSYFWKVNSIYFMQLKEERKNKVGKYKCVLCLLIGSKFFCEFVLIGLFYLRDFILFINLYFRVIEGKIKILYGVQNNFFFIIFQVLFYFNKVVFINILFLILFFNFMSIQSLLFKLIKMFIVQILLKQMYECYDYIYIYILYVCSIWGNLEKSFGCFGVGVNREL